MKQIVTYWQIAPHMDRFTIKLQVTLEENSNTVSKSNKS